MDIGFFALVFLPTFLPMALSEFNWVTMCTEKRFIKQRNWKTSFLAWLLRGRLLSCFDLLLPPPPLEAFFYVKTRWKLLNSLFDNFRWDLVAAIMGNFFKMPKDSHFQKKSINASLKNLKMEKKFSCCSESLESINPLSFFKSFLKVSLYVFSIIF